MGEVLAWIIGWDLILEYGVSFAAVSVGGGAYLVELLDSLFGVTISESICLPPGEGGLRRRQLLGLRPERVQRIEAAAALIFFAYIGFDAVSTGSEETKRPQRDLPIAIVGSLLIATVLYILFSLAAVGALPANQLAGQDAPLAVALSDGAGIGWGADIVTFGALVAITSVALTTCTGGRARRSRCAGTG
jgi:basic amino acid/polyamine antiporter, APA family